MSHLRSRQPDPRLELDSYVGQRSATFRFDIVDAVTGYRRRVHPLRGTAPTLSHDTKRTIKRTLTNLQLDRDDTAVFSSTSSRLEVSMFVRGESYPIGRYVPAAQSRTIRTRGTLSSVTFYDEGVIVDQELDTSFGPQLPFVVESVPSLINRLLTPLPIKFHVASSPYTSSGAWSVGTRRGQAVETLARDGDYLSPWFDHTSTMRFIRSFDPATELATFDLDAGNRVFRDRIIESDDLTTAPNRFVVVGNGAGAVGTDTEIVGVADVPASAPHSIINRGFIIPASITLQIDTSDQAGAVARNLALRNTVVEQVELLTPPDPRHDSYDVLRWRGHHWLETAWSLTLAEGQPMQHVAQRAYTP